MTCVCASFDTTTTEVTATSLFTLPYMWYVNASTFDDSTGTYYGLLNNFPGHANSTLNQKLVIGDFSDTSNPSAVVVDVPLSTVTLHFISWQPTLGGLYGIGIDVKTSEQTIVLIDATTGAFTSVANLGAGASSIGPMYSFGTGTSGDDSAPDASVCAYFGSDFAGYYRCVHAWGDGGQRFRWGNIPVVTDLHRPRTALDRVVP